MTRVLTETLRALMAALCAFVRRLMAGQRFRRRPRYRVTGNRNPFRVRRALLHRAVLKLRHSGPSLDDHV